jgi:hypothetical protein
MSHSTLKRKPSKCYFYFEARRSKASQLLGGSSQKLFCVTRKFGLHSKNMNPRSTVNRANGVEMQSSRKFISTTTTNCYFAFNQSTIAFIQRFITTKQCPNAISSVSWLLRFTRLSDITNDAAANGMEQSSTATPFSAKL